MTFLEFVVLLVIAAVCGAIGQSLAGYSLGGCLISAVVGFIGALLGRWASQQLGLPEPFPLRLGSQPFPILWSIIGSTVFSLLVGHLSRRIRR